MEIELLDCTLNSFFYPLGLPKLWVQAPWAHIWECVELTWKYVVNIETFLQLLPRVRYYRSKYAHHITGLLLRLT